MSLELVNTLATFGTFLVIAGTAIAAIVQLRHARSSNQIEALAELREGSETPEMQAAQRFVRHDLNEKLKDAAFRYQIVNQGTMAPENQSSWTEITRVGNFYENMGALVKSRLADKDLVLDIFSTQVLNNWKWLIPITALVRASRNDNSIWENFEYLTVLSQDWETANPNGAYPVGVRRLELDYPWLEADKQYAASLAPA
jgi:Domain of unknown function (DUF4760)